MTLNQFRNMLDTLPKNIDVVHFRGLNGVLPRLVWAEVRISQEYGSNNAVSEKTTVSVEYLTKDEEDPNVQIIKDLFRKNQMPFICEPTYDEQNDEISYMFNLWLEEEL